ncbi:MAG: universal stress protein [Labilithrix sp.]|nr:universal stress protein [Labilithrix sp.]
MIALPRTAAPVIVVGADLSLGGRNALARAVEVARTSDASVVIVHAVHRLPPQALTPSDDQDQDEAAGEARAAMEELVGEARTSGVDARLRFAASSAVRGLREAAAELAAHLVVVGARGRVMPDALLGSTAERVAFHARSPVLLARRHASEAYRHVLVAVDARGDVRRELDAARFVAPYADVAFLHAYEALHETTLALDGATQASLSLYQRQARREARAALIRQLADAGVSDPRLVLRHGNRRFVLEREARRPSNELLVLERSRSAARRFLLGGAARAVIAHGTVDVLLV